MTRNLGTLLTTVMMSGLLGGCLGGSPATNTTSTTTVPSSNDPAASPVNNSPTNSNNTASADTTNTFSHDDSNTIDPFQVLARIEQEGPPEISTRMHDCGKMKYVTLGNLLSDYGIDPTMGNSSSPGGLYKSGTGALGKADYSNRLAEPVALSTAGAVRLYDIFVAAAPAIISGMPTMARCMVGGVATSMFDSTGACTSPGVACLTGAPATQAQLDLCNSAVQSNTTDTVGSGMAMYTVGQVVAVSTLLSAAHSCE